MNLWDAKFRITHSLNITPTTTPAYKSDADQRENAAQLPSWGAAAEILAAIGKTRLKHHLTPCDRLPKGGLRQYSDTCI